MKVGIVTSVFFCYLTKVVSFKYLCSCSVQFLFTWGTLCFFWNRGRKTIVWPDIGHWYECVWVTGMCQKRSILINMWRPPELYRENFCRLQLVVYVLIIPDKLFFLIYASRKCASIHNWIRLTLRIECNHSIFSGESLFPFLVSCHVHRCLSSIVSQCNILSFQRHMILADVFNELIFYDS